MGGKKSGHSEPSVIMVRVLTEAAKAAMSHIERFVASAELVDIALDRYAPGRYDAILKAAGGSELLARYRSRWTEKPEPLPKGKRIPKSARPRCGASLGAGLCTEPVCYLPDGKTLSTRCRKHGGAGSTGPKSEGGKQRVAEAQRLRWQRYREQKQGFALADDSVRLADKKTSKLSSDDIKLG